MKRLLILCVLPALLWACENSVSNPEAPFEEVSPSLTLLDLPPAACYAEAVPFLADQDISAGTVNVGNDQESLYVIYETSSEWPLQKTSLFVGDGASEIPTNGNGNPKVGQFPYQSKHPGGEHRVIWEVPLSGLSGGTAVIAAFAEVGPVDAKEGAWAEGVPITAGRSWAMSFEHDLLDCARREVGSSGGTVTTLDGTVSLTIPQGALQAPVEITIEPIDITEIGSDGFVFAAEPDGFGGMGAAAESEAASGPGAPAMAVSSDAFLVNGVLPIEETAFRFGPDGLEFDKPVEVILEYDPSNVPAEANEDLLGIFITNAIFAQMPTTREGYRLTGHTLHFSDYFIGLPTESDLLMTALSPSQNPARYDEEFTLSVEGAVSPDGAPVSESEVKVSFTGAPFLVPTVPPACTYDGTNPAGDVFFYTCDPGHLNPGDIVGPFEFVIKPFYVFTPTPETLTITAEITPATASGVTDTNPSNNLLTLDLPVLPDAIADLRVSGVGIGPVVKAGHEMTVTAIVESRPESPDPVDAGLQIQFEAGAAGLEVVSDQLPAGCTYAQGPSGTSVGCQLGTLQPGESKSTQVVVIPIQVGARTASFTAEPKSTDLNPGDNTVGGSYRADPSVVDLAVQIDESFDPILAGQTVVYSATVESLLASEDPLPKGTLRIQAQGDVRFFNASDACEDVSDFVAGVAAAVNCTLPELAPGEAAPDFMGLAVEALSPDQEIQAEALLLLPDYVDDPVQANNSSTETTRVSANIEADLQLTQFGVNPDPARAYQDLIYTMDVFNPIASANDVAGATLELFIQGGVETVSLPVFCSSSSLSFPAQTTITCDLPNLVRGSNQSAFATVRPAGSMVGYNLDATATVSMPDGGVDTDEANNSQNLLTPVVEGEADLLLGPIQDSADPIQEDETVTYSFAVGNSAGSDSLDDAPEGSKITLRLTQGNATLVTASPNCDDLSSAGPEPVIVQCTFGPLPPGAITEYFDVEVAPVGAPQTLEMSAEVTMLTGMIEVDPSSNTGSETTAVNPVQPETNVYVVNQSSANVSVVDANTDAVIQTITVGDNPYAADITPDGREVWVTHTTGFLDIIDTQTNTAELNVLRISSGLQYLAFSPDGARAYFVHPSSGLVTVVDVGTRSAVGTISGMNFPRGIDVLPDGSKAYLPGSGAVYVLDLSSNTLDSTIPMDGEGFFAAASGDNSTVYITQRPSSGSGLIRTIDTSTDAFVGSGIAVSANPYAIELNPAGTEAYVVDSSDSLYFVDLVSGSVITSISVNTRESSRLARTSDGASLFLSSYSDPGSLYEINTASRSVAATTSVGSFPIGVAVKQ